MFAQTKHKANNIACLLLVLQYFLNISFKTCASNNKYSYYFLTNLLDVLLWPNSSFVLGWSSSFFHLTASLQRKLSMSTLKWRTPTHNNTIKGTKAWIISNFIKTPLKGKNLISLNIGLIFAHFILHFPNKMEEIFKISLIPGCYRNT